MKILLPIDGSTYTKKALAFLVTHEAVAEGDGHIVVVNVQPAMPPRVKSMVGTSAINEYHAEEAGKVLRRYWTTACPDCSLKSLCTTGLERRITRWEHEHLLEAVQERLDANPQAMRQRRETVEHPFGTIKARMGATHFLTKTLPKVAAEMALSVLAYNLTRVMNIVGTKSLMAAIAA